VALPTGPVVSQTGSRAEVLCPERRHIFLDWPLSISLISENVMHARLGGQAARAFRALQAEIALPQRVLHGVPAPGGPAGGMMR
jgi:hypothetical protein